MVRSATRPRREVLQVTHLSLNRRATAAQLVTGRAQELPVHSLRISRMLPMARYGIRT